MKKILLVLSMITILVPFAVAAPLDHFDVFLGSGPYVAGETYSIQINAVDDVGDPVNYTGSVTITASTGLVNVYNGSKGAVVTNLNNLDVDHNVTAAFVGGQYVGAIQIYGSGTPNTITIADYMVSSDFDYVIASGDFSEFLMYTRGQTYLPGYPNGVTGDPDVLLLSTTFYVTGTAVDAYYNTTTSWVSDPTFYLDSDSEDIFTPPYTSPVNLAVQTVPGTFIWAALIIDDDNNNIIAQGSLYRIINREFTSLNNYYMWANINGVPNAPFAEVPVVAGEEFTVALTISNYEEDQGEAPVNLNDNQMVGFVQYSLLSPTGPDEVTVTVSVGQGSTPFTFDTMQRIRARPYFDPLWGYIAAGKFTETADSNIIQIYAGPPVDGSFTMASDKTHLKVGETAAISVSVFDEFGNKVSRTAVNYTVNGILDPVPVLTGNYNPLTGDVPASVFNYTATSVPPEQVVIEADVLGSTKSVMVVLLSGTDVGPNKNDILNSPNPFNPLKEDTKISYYLEEESSVNMKLYNMFGKLVWSHDLGNVVPDPSKPSNYAWDGTTNGGFKVGVGLYVLKLTVKNSSEEYTLSRKIAVLK